MSRIHFLSPKVISQIAAGEIVERPSSVVKELIENSIDAGANCIDISIERGGLKLIRICDNGNGIAKEDIRLALERHATSKISVLEDLEAILSLGFRGEALSSISSVSRLILTSRIAGQAEAWQVYTEGGYDMKVFIKPAAHPIGTTVEVIDIFYNTPARRKFLRTEKTEFLHIDEIIRRISLVYFNIAIKVFHNGKLIRQYHAINLENEKEKRLVTIFGNVFLKNLLKLFSQSIDLVIKGWISYTPVGNLSGIQYFYVNKRIIRNRLINHAIRQAYIDVLKKETQISYVLYLDIDPYQIDVNVHPSKYEVRFYQMRLVHDFIYQAIRNLLKRQQTKKIFDNAQIAVKKNANFVFGLKNNSVINKNYLLSYKSKEKPLIIKKKDNAILKINNQNILIYEKGKHFSDSFNKNFKKKENISYQNYFEDFKNKKEKITFFSTIKFFTSRRILAKKAFIETNNTFGKLLTVYADNFALIESSLGIYLLSLIEANRYLQIIQLIPINTKLKSQPLLVPIDVNLSENNLKIFNKKKILFSKLGFKINILNTQATIVAVSDPLKSQDLSKLFLNLLEYFSNNILCELYELVIWLVDNLLYLQKTWTIPEGIQLLNDLELICPELLRKPPKKMLHLIDLKSIIKMLKND
ncbi:DNA mismatch repair endonuclease MutL [Arsenophonus symbiont of Ornithomya chloropus]|uniref:DNA mismatch repair endonuclease MutL n=1 Tax=Arsenophonus symbiont of Ornithomya chloropus TaxID=634121 RepID=UPI0032B1A475